MNKARRQWKLLRHSRTGQRVWQDAFTGDIYLADHSGDDANGRVGHPDQTDDGPLRVIKRGKTDTVCMDGLAGIWFVEVRAERTQENGTVVIDLPCALFVAGQLGVVPTIFLNTPGGFRSYRVEAA